LRAGDTIYVEIGIQVFENVDTDGVDCRCRARRRRRPVIAKMHTLVVLSDTSSPTFVPHDCFLGPKPGPVLPVNGEGHLSD
jgi:hypothetical protein